MVESCREEFYLVEEGRRGGGGAIAKVKATVKSDDA